jgi:hypothetical protein
LGPDLLAGLGYDYTELEAKLNAVPCIQKEIVVAWKRVFRSEKTFSSRLYLITFELLQQRRLPHSAKQFAKLLLGRL